VRDTNRSCHITATLNGNRVREWVCEREIMNYTAKNMPKWAIYMYIHIFDVSRYVRCGMQSGVSVDQIAPRFSFFFGIGMNFYLEIAKLRAARRSFFYIQFFIILHILKKQRIFPSTPCIYGTVNRL
jgi:hypothetical protein